MTLFSSIGTQREEAEVIIEYKALENEVGPFLDLRSEGP